MTRFDIKEHTPVKFPSLTEWNEMKIKQWTPEFRKNFGVVKYAGVSCPKEDCDSPMIVPESNERLMGSITKLKVKCPTCKHVDYLIE
jgi:hypothetical protein